MFEEDKHLKESFNDNKQRSRYFDDMQLSVPIDLYKYCPGGNVVSIVFVAKVNVNRSSDEALVEPIRVVSQIHNQLPEFHTRAQKRYFKQKLQNIANIKPGVVDFIYKELAMDASQVSHPETQERLRLISLGETGLVADLRDLNTGRPSDKFDVFFEKLQEVVESVTAVDDRRHGELHLSRWLSLEEMIREAAEKCREDTLIPSKSLVRLQFTPRNPYSHAALNLTGKIDVQYKVQRRQLRVAHQDQHICAALFQYMKCKAVELGKYGQMVCSDDKAKVPIGNPGLPISTGVRGKKTITPTSCEMVAGDHDMHCTSLTPSVYLLCKVPDTTEKSFVSGKVHVAVNDSVLQTSSPFRHAALLSKVIAGPECPKVLLRYSDGGTDQRNTLESVKCASICLFKELDLDLMVLARCAPGNSWVNPAERVMSILNIGLQNCALERRDDDGAFKSVNSMSQVREVIGKRPDLKEAWVSNIEPCQAVVQNRFARLTLKGEKFQIENPVTEDEIDVIKRHLRELFPDLDITKLQKAHTRSAASYQKWLDDHARQRQYSFQIRKCQNADCCLPATTPPELLEWLPDPMFETGKEHYKPYNVVKGQDTDDHDRPSYKAPQNKGTSNIKGATTYKQTTDSVENDTTVDASMFTAQTARYSTDCVECKKPKVIFSKNKLTDRQQMQLVILLSEHEYTCGSFVTVPGSALHNKVHVRLGLTCETPIELAFYRSEFAKTDLCCLCASADGYVDEELKKGSKLYYQYANIVLKKD
ncbi:uncharacterized protein LOC128230468 isoform X1 [Mya arenaria]|nr:uncharacterized protein LOC128230468 isoform X1 [Mya arenaria]XP_052798705.1 uncharacterized protein LOC128230468 isoform X1 [Mya arenaria]XP_052798706.1 uncharacterized protein LOC128230468 isoform X1 [Mya arenaria]XP_052798707.1 uncharacterized protein LOC128230468 isoform X1 [Mya arenaria]XP_052798708.1 uncharacterized protein LOC128230468 isoform X1 [Mya arenaria]